MKREYTTDRDCGIPVRRLRLVDFFWQTMGTHWHGATLKSLAQTITDGKSGRVELWGWTISWEPIPDSYGQHKVAVEEWQVVTPSDEPSSPST